MGAAALRPFAKTHITRCERARTLGEKTSPVNLFSAIFAPISEAFFQLFSGNLILSALQCWVDKKFPNFLLKH